MKEFLSGLLDWANDFMGALLMGSLEFIAQDWVIELLCYGFVFGFGVITIVTVVGGFIAIIGNIIMFIFSDWSDWGDD